MGDIDGDNQVLTSDYNIILDCYGSSDTAPASKCSSHTDINGNPLSDKYVHLFADLDDTGTVDGAALNLVLRHFQQTGYGTLDNN